MNDLEKKIINIARQHDSFDEGKAMAELAKMNAMDTDLAGNLWSLYTTSQDKKQRGDRNSCQSVLAYYMGITSQAPEAEFTLEKRRTYGRSGFPDIDMDFDYLRRPEIIAYLIEKYGREYVGNIGTVQTFKIKAAVRRAIKVLDPTNSIRFDKDGKEIKGTSNENFALENEILRTLPSLMKSSDGRTVDTVQEAYEEYTQFQEYMDKYPEVFRTAKGIEGTVAGFGCLSSDTVIKTKHGNCRIDQVDGTVSISYIDADGQMQCTSNYFAHKTGNKKCYKLKLQDDSWVKITDEHLVFTDKGIVKFEKIRQNPQNYKVWSMKK